MAKLTAAEKRTLAALKAKSEAPDVEDYEIRIRNDKGAEATVPASRAVGWLRDNFGIALFDEDEDDTGDEGSAGGDPDDADADAGDGDAGEGAPAGKGIWGRR